MPLRRDEVVDAALELLDETGLDGLTTRRLAQRLGVQVGAIYWHISSKRELLAAMADRIGEDIRDQPLLDGDWAEQVAGFAQLSRRAMLAHRDGARLVVNALPTRSLLEGANRLIELLRAAGASDELAVLALDTLMSHVTGFVLQEQSQGPESSEDADPGRPLPEDFRDFTWAEKAQFSQDKTFALELELIIDGLRTALTRG
jgi:TetR/AcrR family tetracycline transcriptional repressor